MTKHTDDDVDDALRQWGDGHRRAAAGATPPSIADLLARRNRQRSVIAVAATVVLVAALAVGLGLGIRSERTPSATRTVPHATHSTQRTTDAPATPCWQQFVDSGSVFRGQRGRGIVSLRYSGSSKCRVFEMPQLVLVSADRRVSGPHRPPATLNRTKTVVPGQTIRFDVALALTCPSIPTGRYTVRVYLRPAAQPSATSGVAGPVIALRPSEQDRTMGCPTGRLTAGSTSHLSVVSSSTASTIDDLTRIARREAAADGDRSATAEAVRTTYGQVEDTILDSTTTGSRNNTVWVIQLRGAFVCGSCSVPPGASAPRGRSVVLVLQEPGLRLGDSSVENRHYDLAKLGTVVPLLP